MSKPNVRRLYSRIKAKPIRAVHVRMRRCYGDSAYKRSTGQRRLNLCVIFSKG